MKKNVILLIMLITGTVIYAQNTSQITPKTKLLVYYFHLTSRCHTCTNIEATTKKVLDENFKTELDSGIIIFKTFNVDLPENKKICKKYDAYGATLAVTYFQSGKEKIEDLTNFAFSKIYTEPVFISGLKLKIQEHLK